MKVVNSVIIKNYERHASKRYYWQTYETFSWINDFQYSFWSISNFSLKCFWITIHSLMHRIFHFSKFLYFLQNYHDILKVIIYIFNFLFSWEYNITLKTTRTKKTNIQCHLKILQQTWRIFSIQKRIILMKALKIIIKKYNCIIKIILLNIILLFYSNFT